MKFYNAVFGLQNTLDSPSFSFVIDSVLINSHLHFFQLCFWWFIGLFLCVLNQLENGFLTSSNKIHAHFRARKTAESTCILFMYSLAVVQDILHALFSKRIWKSILCLVNISVVSPVKSNQTSILWLISFLLFIRVTFCYKNLLVMMFSISWHMEPSSESHGYHF